MNIWMISKYASPPGYGTGLRFFYLTKEFAKLGHSSVLITSDANHYAPNFPNTDNRYNSVTIDDTKVVWIKTLKYKKTASPGRILSWLDFEWKLFFMPKKDLGRPDAVVVSSISIFTIFYGYYLKWRYQSFLVFEIRDIWPLTMTEEAGFKWYHPLVLFIGFVEKFGYKVADLVVGTMPRLDLHVRNILGYDRPTFCSPFGFYPGNYDADTQTDNSFKKHFPVGKIIVGYAGSMGITNALESYVECIKMLNTENKDIHFMFVGSGDLRPKFEAELAGCNNVTFLPRITQSEVKFFLANCDILYLSTQDSKVWDYGQSMNKVVEYMLSAKPIIARYSGYPSMINEAGCGIFVSSNQALDIKNAILKYALMPKSERENIGKMGREWIYKHRQYDKLAAEYMSEIQARMESSNSNK
ncbi:MAG: glycosyltransferase family 4 protein [Chitinophagales bacterium]|nr:glycosyltransferase family 4 protein [Chitinophagales bacterium]